jgi:hypothetical protein
LAAKVGNHEGRLRRHHEVHEEMKVLFVSVVLAEPSWCKSLRALRGSEAIVVSRRLTTKAAMPPSRRSRKIEIGFVFFVSAQPSW